jgi:hypothetical protein
VYKIIFFCGILEFVLHFSDGDKMPLVRKLIPLGKSGSRAVCIPKSWLEYYERENSETIEAVTIEVNRELKILPYTPRKK